MSRYLDHSSEKIALPHDKRINDGIQIKAVCLTPAKVPFNISTVAAANELIVNLLAILASARTG